MIQYVIICLLSIYNLVDCAEKSTNPFTSATIQDSTIVFENDTFIKQIFKLYDAEHLKKETTQISVEKLNIIYAWLYYIDRGAVQKAKKNDYLKLFNTIKLQSKQLKENLLKKMIDDENNIRFSKDFNSIITDLENNIILKELSTLPMAQVYVLPELQPLVEAKKSALDADLDKINIEKENELVKHENTFAQKRDTLNQYFEKNIQILEEQKKAIVSNIEKYNKNKKEIIQKTKEQEELVLRKKSEAQELIKQLERLQTELSTPSDELDIQKRKLLVLQKFKKIFEKKELQDAAKEYYTAQEEYDAENKKDSTKLVFALAKSFLGLDPAALKNKKDNFSTVVHEIIRELVKILAEQKLERTVLKGGFDLLTKIANQTDDMPDQATFNAIGSGIDKSIAEYSTIPKIANLSETQSQINATQTMQKIIENEITEITEQRKLLTNETISVEKTISLEQESLNAIGVSILEKKNNHTKDLENLNNENVTTKELLNKEFVVKIMQIQEQYEQLYTQINYEEPVKKYISKLKKLSIIHNQHRFFNIKLSSELLSLVSQPEQTVTVDSLAIDGQEETITQKAVRFKQSITEGFAALYAKIKSNSTHVPEKNPNIYFTMSATLLNDVHNKGLEWQSQIKKMHTACLLMLNSTNPQTSIQKFGILNSLLKTYVYPAYDMLQSFNSSISTHYILKQKNINVEALFQECLDTINSVLKNTEESTLTGEIKSLKENKYTSQLALAFFTTVAHTLKNTINSQIISKFSIDTKDFIHFHNQLNQYETILDIIEQTQLIWYENASELRKLFEPIKQLILEKKALFLDRTAEEILKITREKQSSAYDFEIKNNLLNGKIVEEVKVIYRIQEWGVWVKLLFTDNEWTQILKKQQSSLWTQTGKQLLLALEAKEKIVQGNHTLYGQTMYPLYKQAIAQLKRIGLNKVTIKVSYNPFASEQ